MIVGVDGSDSSLQAVDWAVDEAALRGLSLRLVHASLWERYEGVMPSFTIRRPSGRTLADHIVTSAAERATLRNPAVEVSTAVLPEDTVAGLSREGHAGWGLVVGCRGRGGIARSLLGSVSLEAAGIADCPVVVVRGEEWAGRKSGNHRIVLGVGHRDTTSAATEFAFEEAALRGAKLHAVHAWRLPVTDAVDHRTSVGDATDLRLQQAERALDEALRAPAGERPDVAVDRQAVEGTARRALLDAAATADLLVVGARSRGRGLPGLQLGLVNHAVLHHALCPVAVIPAR